jgi:N-acetylglucosamine malate deacetylase 1
MDNGQLRIMIIGAHPDDCETLAGGLAIKYRRLGHAVKFVCATTGDAAHPTLGGGAVARMRAEETRRGCELAGIEYEILDIHSNMLVPDLIYREMFIRLIRKFSPDLIFTHRQNDYHPDHRYTSILVQDSIYAVCVPNVCALTPCLTYRPIILFLYDEILRPAFIPDIIIDIDDAIEAKVQMCNTHKSSMYEWGPWIDGKMADVPEEDEKRLDWLRKTETLRVSKIADIYRDRLIKSYGQEHGSKVQCAEAFEICPITHSGILNEDENSLYFPF